jgi:light-regulated signal transduction histidine kinase (bacteriophytochrome)
VSLHVIAIAKGTSLLKAVNKDFEAFSYSVSSDLCAPLRAMNGFSWILIEDYAAELPDDDAISILCGKTPNRWAT